ncbi:hypothetical protein SS50377_20764 [Spironucleus salmonicida]|uniref:Uncharacterized protein n=1 Tax=Spironucleus salmonicida TaxID=348837 RepID=V6LR17_9EUKA|nr:hypothetical protein SS50377_20764 [Spironucleus salmonicida]|eukprot:EST47127.1 Hypothetical protein SS50377_12835 [Spironucleus salmonicida]
MGIQTSKKSVEIYQAEQADCMFGQSPRSDALNLPILRSSQSTSMLSKSSTARLTQSIHVQYKAQNRLKLTDYITQTLKEDDEEELIDQNIYISKVATI